MTPDFQPSSCILIGKVLYDIILEMEQVVLGVKCRCTVGKFYTTKFHHWPKNYAFSFLLVFSSLCVVCMFMWKLELTSVSSPIILNLIS